MPEPAASGRIELGPRAWVREEDLLFRFIRSSGPGGQNVNKVSTAAELRVLLGSIGGLDEDGRERLRALAGRRLNAAGEIVLRAETSRSQRENREICISKLRDLAAAAARRPKVRRATRPTRGSQQRRLESKAVRGRIKSARRRPEE